MDDKENIIGCIICEGTKNNVEFKVHNVDKNGFVIAEGILQEGNEVNRNKRFYPTEELARAIMSPRQQELISTGNFKGEAGHPLDQSLTRQQKIDPTNEQVWYLKLWMDGDYVMGRFRGTNNALGESFNRDLKDGQRPSFSLRALGSLVNENGRMTVRNMQIVTYDRVYFPSHSKAYTTKIITTESAGNKKDVVFYEINRASYFYNKRDEINAIAEAGNSVEFPSLITKFTQDEINRYVAQESANIKSLINNFGVFYESVNLSPDMKTVTMKTKLGDKIYVTLEQAIQKEIMNEVFKMF